jgi:hypothetical protein
VAKPHRLVGRTLTLTFEEVDATPDLHEVGPVRARVTAVVLEGSPPSEKIAALVQSPPDMEGLAVALSARYEGEPLAAAEKGAWVTVEAFFTDKGGRAVAGGIGSATFEA